MRQGTVVRVADNSGARYVRIIKVLRKSPKGYGIIGDQLIASVLHVNPKKKVKKGQIVRVMVIRSSFPILREDGQQLKFQSSAVVVVDKNGTPRSTKIYGPTVRELRKKGLIRLISLSTIAI
ncbi:50S ribosomal protein L14 [bacterium]|nr:MAG: 50S ribosomal protein L14 [bacterium]